MSTTPKYTPPVYNDEQKAAEEKYNYNTAHYGNLFCMAEKQKYLLANATGVVLEVAAGCCPTLPQYAESNNNNKVTTLIYTEPAQIPFHTGMKMLTQKLDVESDMYSGSYEEITGLTHPTTKEGVAAWKFVFTAVNGKEADVPLNIPIYYIQTDIDGAGPLATQVLPEGLKVDTVVSSFGVCYVCCFIHPLDYLLKLQVLFGPKKEDNAYTLLMLEHGQTEHPEVNPAENPYVKRDGGVKFRHLFELMADARLIIKKLEHHPHTNQTEPPFMTFHTYECEPNDQTAWLKTQQEEKKD